MDIVDRAREIDELRRVAAEPPALVILRGRRRIGKTFLLRAALTGERVVFYQAEERPQALQLESFARECASLLPGAPPLNFEQWSDAFDFLERNATTEGRLTIVLDEVQYIVASDTGVESTVQRFWDRWEASGTPIVLVLSGSALTFMSQLLGGTRPIFGRSILRPLLLPLTYRDIAPFAPSGASGVDLIERFAAFGGTPQYQVWAGRRALTDAVERAYLRPQAPLYSDPEHLIRE